ncbi:hypothetical protein SISSUDRAFT_984497, partial [Sistotremastrum suecicum HHB10207 ss-3]
YIPSNITANPGDTVSFEFVTKNHTVTQSTFAAPCSQLVNATTGAVGINSGYQPVAANATVVPSWTFQVLDTNPLWFFCLQGSHCQQGMVFSINATPNKTFEAFQAAAKNTTQSVPAPDNNGQTTVNATDVSNLTMSSTASPTSLPSGATSSGSGTSTSSTATKSNSAMRVGGSAAGLVTFLAFAIGVTI